MSHARYRLQGHGVLDSPPLHFISYPTESMGGLGACWSFHTLPDTTVRVALWLPYAIYFLTHFVCPSSFLSFYYSMALEAVFLFHLDMDAYQALLPCFQRYPFIPV